MDLIEDTANAAFAGVDVITGQRQAADLWGIACRDDDEGEPGALAVELLLEKLVEGLLTTVLVVVHRLGKLAVDVAAACGLEVNPVAVAKVRVSATPDAESIQFPEIGNL